MTSLRLGMEEAFPRQSVINGCGGLTKREYIAAKIMANLQGSGMDPEERARWSVKHADALLEELAKEGD